MTNSLSTSTLTQTSTYSQASYLMYRRGKIGEACLSANDKYARAPRAKQRHATSPRSHTPSFLLDNRDRSSRWSALSHPREHLSILLGHRRPWPHENSVLPLTISPHGLPGQAVQPPEWAWTENVTNNPWKTSEKSGEYPSEYVCVPHVRAQWGAITAQHGAPCPSVVTATLRPHPQESVFICRRMPALWNPVVHQA